MPDDISNTITIPAMDFISELTEHEKENSNEPDTSSEKNPNTNEICDTNDDKNENIGDEYINEKEQTANNETIRNPNHTNMMGPKKTKIRTPGIIYLSQLPHDKSLYELKEYLSQYGEIKKVYLVPMEDPSLKPTLRKKRRGRTAYKEGWVEYHDKKDAKMTARMLHSSRVDISKSGSHYDEFWCIKYLSGFLWHHLTESLGGDKSGRTKVLMDELSREKQALNSYRDVVRKTSRRNAYLKKTGQKEDVEKVVEGKKREIKQRPPIIKRNMDKVETQ